MPLDCSLTTARVHEAFADEVGRHGGEVMNRFDDGQRLFARSVLPAAAEVRPGDGLRGGVAVRAFGGDVWVHPYVFRLVCKNGAIRAQTIASRRVTVGSDPDLAAWSIREAVADCCQPDVFVASVAEARSAVDAEVDLALTLLPLIGRLAGHGGGGIVRQIVERFFADGDRSRFGLMNAVTSVARDTADPQVRWNLEEFGGGVPAAAKTPPRLPPAQRRAARRTVELVG